jgi:hypothetical protein
MKRTYKEKNELFKKAALTMLYYMMEKENLQWDIEMKKLIKIPKK